MNSLIKYGFYFVVAFSVLAFGAAEDGKGQKSEVRGRRTGRDRSHPSTQSYAVPRRTEVGGQTHRRMKRQFWAERHQDQAASCTSALIFEPILRSATASSYLV